MIQPKPLQGYLIDLQLNGSDWRDFLPFHADDGTITQRAVHNGAHLYLCFEDRWILVRYETMFPRATKRVWLFFDHTSLITDGIELCRNSMLFRWQ